MACREKLTSTQVLLRNINYNNTCQERVEVVEGGAHWQPKGKFSVELMRIFAEASK